MLSTNVVCVRVTFEYLAPDGSLKAKGISHAIGDLLNITDVATIAEESGINGVAYILANVAVWIVGIFLLSVLTIVCIRLVARAAGINFSFVDLLRRIQNAVTKTAGGTKKFSGGPFFLSILGITIYAESPRGKIMFVIFLSIIPTLIGSTALAIDLGGLLGANTNIPIPTDLAQAVVPP